MGTGTGVDIITGLRWAALTTMRKDGAIVRTGLKAGPDDPI